MHKNRKLKTNKITNLLMFNGKKSCAFKIYLKSIAVLKAHSFEERTLRFAQRAQSVQLYKEVIDIVKPSVETRKVRIGGSVYQVPSIIQEKRQNGLAIRWIINSSQSKKRASNRFFAQSLGQELFETLKRDSQSAHKRDQVQQLAANNRGYARYRWW